MRIVLFILFFLPIFSHAQDTAKIFEIQSSQLEVDPNTSFVIRGGEQLTIHISNTTGEVALLINEEQKILNFINGKGNLSFQTDNNGELVNISIPGGTKQFFHISTRKDGSLRVVKIPGWCSLIPPLIAIFLALLFKEVVLSLFLGIWAGAFIAGGFRIFSIFYFLQSFFQTLTKYVVNALNDVGHLSVVMFSLLIGGMVAIISKNGGMNGVVNSLARYASTRMNAQLMTWLLGLAIFFDDYANTLIVGNTMRNLTDSLKISREKLAYIVDSTAAPVSAIAFITTWIGAELGFIASGLQGLEGYTFTTSPYYIYIQSLKYSFYPILTILFIYMLIRSGKDFGPMLKAEMRAVKTGQVSPAKTKDEDEPNMEDLTPIKGSPKSWHHAFWPIFTTIFITVLGLVSTGMDSSYAELIQIKPLDYTWGAIWTNISLLGDGESNILMNLGTLIGQADSYVALLWGSLSGVVVAIGITLYHRIMDLWTTMHWMVNGFKTMMPALLILTLAWALAAVTQELGTADFLTGLLGQGVHPAWIPGGVFVLSFVVAFSTGSSWSTMAILYPIGIPLVWTVSINYGLDPNHAFELMLNTIATVLAASVLGDHCSPISDTTILSSLATDCNHIDHVKTQMPYALLVGVFSLACVALSALLAWGVILSLSLIVISLAGLYAYIEWKGEVAKAD